MTKIKPVEAVAKDLSKGVRFFSGYGQYEKGSPESEAYLNGVETAIGMMFIDLTDSPKSKGVITQDRTQLIEAACEVLEGISLTKTVIHDHEYIVDKNGKEIIADAQEALRGLLDK